MKITAKTLQAFNYMTSKQEWPCMNDSWNKANGRPTVEEYKYLNQIKSSTFGMFGGALTRKHLSNY